MQSWAKSLTHLRLCFLIELSRRVARIIFMKMRSNYQIKSNTRLPFGGKNLSCPGVAGGCNGCQNQQLVNNKE